MSKEMSVNKIESMAVSVPPVKENIGRIIGIIIGLTFAGIGVLMMLSLILFIPGIFAVLIGLFVAVLCTPKLSVKCPLCDTESNVVLKSKQLKCEGCDNITPLRWSSPKNK